MGYVQALVRLWDREQRGYTMREVAVEAEMDLEWKDEPGERIPEYIVAATVALANGMAIASWSDDDKTAAVLLRPVLA